MLQLCSKFRRRSSTLEFSSSMTTRQVASEFGWQSGSESDDDWADCCAASRMKRERKGRERSGRFPCLELPAGFIRFSDAISRLANGMLVVCNVRLQW